MDDTILRGPSLADLFRASEPIDEQPWPGARPTADEMARVLGTTPRRIVTELSGSSIAHWNHGELHDVVEPMKDHVIMTYIGTMQRLERRTGRTLASGTARPGVVTIIPSGTSSRWDIGGAVDVLQLYLPHAVLERVAAEADTSGPAPLLERTGHLDPTTSRLLMSAADVLDGSEALDALFRQQLTDLLATRLLSAHTGTPASTQPALGGLAPTALRHRAPALGQRRRPVARRARRRCAAVAFPFLPRLQAEHRAVAACLVAAAPTGAGLDPAARHR